MHLQTPSHQQSRHSVRIELLAKKVFGDDGKATRWLRRPKTRFDGRSPVELLSTEGGAQLVEEMLLQLDHGFVA